jgi:SCY1-like protein 1
LIQSFVRSLHDPFPPARKTALVGIAASSSLFSPQDLAKKILPAICPLLVDTETSIRDQARTTMDAILKILKNAPAPVVTSESKPVEPKQESGWTNWAISAVKSGINKSVDTIDSKSSNQSSSPVGEEPKRLTPTSSTSGPTGSAILGNASKVPQKSVPSLGTRAPMTLKKTQPSASDWANPPEIRKEFPKAIATTNTAPDGWGAWDDGWDDDNKKHPPSPVKSKAVGKNVASPPKGINAQKSNDDGWGNDDNWDDQGWANDNWK